jgi:DNA invertase Pin-like site-specific DNA recombinase
MAHFMTARKERERERERERRGVREKARRGPETRLTLQSQSNPFPPARSQLLVSATSQ